MFDFDLTPFIRVFLILLVMAPLALWKAGELIWAVVKHIHWQ